MTKACIVGLFAYIIILIWNNFFGPVCITNWEIAAWLFCYVIVDECLKDDV